ncbi:MAG: hypothetical protein E3K36_06430 [Candidatus Brocadia sp.]|nr:hypothetical protein [Candidatus Brocadia sp.]
MVVLESSLNVLKDTLKSPNLFNDVKDIDAMLCKITENNFVDQGNNIFDTITSIDDFEHFGRDRFPLMM